MRDGREVYDGRGGRVVGGDGRRLEVTLATAVLRVVLDAGGDGAHDLLEGGFHVVVGPVPAGGAEHVPAGDDYAGGGGESVDREDGIGDADDVEVLGGAHGAEHLGGGGGHSEGVGDVVSHLVPEGVLLNGLGHLVWFLGDVR